MAAVGFGCTIVFGILVMTVGLALGTGASIGCGYAAKQHKHDY
jgi:Na+-driven multidrug efflux pump